MFNSSHIVLTTLGSAGGRRSILFIRSIGGIIHSMNTHEKSFVSHRRLQTICVSYPSKVEVNIIQKRSGASTSTMQQIALRLEMMHRQNTFRQLEYFTLQTAFGLVALLC